MKRMHLSSIIVLLLLSMYICCDSKSVQNTDYPVVHTFSSSYVQSAPIEIIGDADFSSQASTNGWDGNGTLYNPFIIKEMNITLNNDSQILISISHTTVYFIIQDNRLNGGLDCIRLVNVTNGRVEGNQIEKASSNGVYLMQCSDSIIDANRIRDNIQRGVLVDYSRNCTLSENHVDSNNGIGINLRDSINISIIANSVYNNSQGGVTLGRSDFCVIVGNMIHNNSYTGVSIESSTDTQLTQNIIFKNIGVGLSIVGPRTNVIGNTFYRNHHVGIRVQVQPTSISQNNFVENGYAYPEVQQADSNVGGITFLHNFWDDLVTPDWNGDDIVDVPYTIRGLETNQDHFPHVYIYPTNDIHILTRPTPIFPNSALETLFYHGMMNITWGPASDTFEHPITYTLQYSNDQGATWSYLVTEIVDTFYEWNTNESEQDVEYVLRVVAICSNASSSKTFDYSSFNVTEHVLSQPTIIVPASGDVIGDRFTIQWVESTDSWNHYVNYSLYYSSDGGLTWLTIVDKIEETHYRWFIGALPDGQYMLRIVAQGNCSIVNEYIMDGEFTLNHNFMKILTRSVAISGVIIMTCVIVIWYRRRASSSIT